MALAEAVADAEAVLDAVAPPLVLDRALIVAADDAVFIVDAVADLVPVDVALALAVADADFVADAVAVTDAVPVADPVAVLLADTQCVFDRVSEAVCDTPEGNALCDAVTHTENDSEGVKESEGVMECVAVVVLVLERLADIVFVEVSLSEGGCEGEGGADTAAVRDATDAVDKGEGAPVGVARPVAETLKGGSWEGAGARVVPPEALRGAEGARALVVVADACEGKRVGDTEADVVEVGEREGGGDWGAVREAARPLSVGAAREGVADGGGGGVGAAEPLARGGALAGLLPLGERDAARVTPGSAVAEGGAEGVGAAVSGAEGAAEPLAPRVAVPLSAPEGVRGAVVAAGERVSAREGTAAEATGSAEALPGAPAVADADAASPDEGAPAALAEGEPPRGGDALAEGVTSRAGDNVARCEGAGGREGAAVAVAGAETKALAEGRGDGEALAVARASGGEGVPRALGTPLRDAGSVRVPTAGALTRAEALPLQEAILDAVAGRVAAAVRVDVAVLVDVRERTPIAAAPRASAATRKPRLKPAELVVPRSHSSKNNIKVCVFGGGSQLVSWWISTSLAKFPPKSLNFGGNF